jgi:hypothetical protein
MKSILKLIYVVVLPLAVLLSPVYLTVAHELSYTVVLVITIVTLINAIFWLVHMTKISFIPSVVIQFTPVFGFGIALPKTSDWKIDYESQYQTLQIILPFTSIYFGNKKK